MKLPSLSGNYNWNIWNIPLSLSAANSNALSLVYTVHNHYTRFNQNEVPQENDASVIGTSIGKVIFTDGDDGSHNSQLEYSINDPFFTINEFSGEIIINQQLDREAQCLTASNWDGKYRLKVTATDKCSDDHFIADNSCKGLSTTHEIAVSHSSNISPLIQTPISVNYSRPSPD